MDLTDLEIAHSNLIQRCYNQNDPSYPYYGQRGIKVCLRWRGRYGCSNFVRDILKTLGPRPEGKTQAGLAQWQLDRIDSEKGYCISNLKWSSIRENQLNRRQHKRRTRAIPAYSNASTLMLVNGSPEPSATKEL
jgi:hypothetical protein